MGLRATHLSSACALLAAGLSLQAPFAAAQSSNGTVRYEVDLDGEMTATLLLSVLVTVAMVSCFTCCTCFYRISILQRMLRATRLNPRARNGDGGRARHEDDEGWGDIGRDGAVGFQSAILQAGYASFAGGGDDDAEADADADASGSGGSDSPSPGSGDVEASQLPANRLVQQREIRMRNRTLIKQIQRGVVVATASTFIFATLLGPAMLIIGIVCFSNDAAHKGICGPAGYYPTTTKCDSVCSNTCAFAFNGICNDGRDNATSSLCAYGTDCSDCSEDCEAALYSVSGGVLYVVSGCIFTTILCVLMYYLIIGSRYMRARQDLHQRKKTAKLTTCSNCDFQYNVDFDACTMCGARQVANPEHLVDGSSSGSGVPGSPTAKAPILDKVKEVRSNVRYKVTAG